MKIKTTLLTGLIAILFFTPVCSKERLSVMEIGGIGEADGAPVEMMTKTFKDDLDAVGKYPIPKIIIPEGAPDFKFPNGADFYGQSRDGNLLQGVLIYPDGSKYRGLFNNNNFSGHGTYESTSGYVYDGEFVDGKRHGGGTLVFSDGKKYVGQFVQDQKSGLGVLTWPNGTVYEGEFQADIAQGKGTLNSPGGEYSGQFAGGLPNGKGMMHYANGSSYDGEWRKNLPHGRGTYTYPDGQNLKGSFRDGDFIR